METHEQLKNDKEKIIEFVKSSEKPKEIEFLLVIINQVFNENIERTEEI